MSEKIVSRYGSYRFMLYVSEADEEPVKAFIHQCRVKGTTASREIMVFIRGQIPTTQEPTGKEMLNCHFCDKVGETYLVRWASGQRLRACPECFMDREKKGLVRFVLKRPEETKGL